MSVKDTITQIAVEATQDALNVVQNLRAQQTTTSDIPLIGVVVSVDGAAITITLADNSTQVVQAGPRWLSKGDITVVVGGMAY